MFELTDIQKEMVNKGINIISEYNILYLMFETQVGKTPTSLKIAEQFSKDILFITKKKMLKEIPSYIEKFGIKANVTAISMDSIHKEKYVPCRVIIVDESHSFGAYPKPSLRQKALKRITGDNIVIFLSATPTPEKYSQIYHQLGVSIYSPFNKYKSFYKWADDYVQIKEKWINGIAMKCYDYAKVERINPYLDMFKLTLTKESAGFKHTEIKEHKITVPMEKAKVIYDIVSKFDICTVNDKYIISGETAAKKMSKLHQLCGGTVITECGSTIPVDRSKIEYINKHFKNKKIAIYYKFDGERELIERYLQKEITKNVADFREAGAETCFISQFQSGREGISLATADYLIFYNIPHSYLDYEQSRNRVTNMNRETQPQVVYLLSDLGLDKKILKTVQNKKQYTLNHFRKEFEK